MRIRAWATATVAAGICAGAAEPASAAERSLTVCMEIGHDGLIRTTAQPEVSRIFAEIGVRVDWQPDARSCAGGEGMIVTLSYETPPTKYPNAWAYALPYEGTHIVVFYDRVQKTIDYTGARNLLAYVLAHELTHVLEGVSRHSEAGIMKAAWDSGDYFDMGRRALHFAPLDVSLLYRGLDARKVRLAVRETGTGQ